MKKIWNKRNKEGVSPVIATILMVAITVVLAAVLYVMVMDMVKEDPNKLPVGSWQSAEATDSDSARLVYGTLSGDVAPKEVRIIVEGGGEMFTLSIPGDLVGQTTNMTVIGAAGVSASYTDMNYIGNNIGAGDYITINGLAPGTVYNVQQFHIEADAVMTGGDESFQTLG